MKFYPSFDELVRGLCVPQFCSSHSEKLDSISNQMVTRLGHTVIENKVNNSFFRLEFYIFS